MLKQIVMITLLLVLTTSISARALTITLAPVGGSLSGTAGSTVGWGYSVTNDSLTEWVVLSGSTFDTPATWGTYNDYIHFDFVALAPGTSYSEAFDALNKNGIGSFAIDSMTLPGFTAAGNINLSFDRYTGDPMNGGSYIGMLLGLAAADVTVSADAPVPEPGTMLLLGSGLVGLLPLRRRIMGKLS